MQTLEFKAQLKEKKESLKGKTIRIVLNGVSERYNTLRSLGNRILELEYKGYCFSFYKNDATTILVNNGVSMNRVMENFGINA